jgi:hypothetical protein
VWSLREIESDINLGLYYPYLTEGVDGFSASFESWYLHMQQRLEEWYQAIRRSVNLTEKIEFHELLFQIQVLRLNRPSLRCPAPTLEMRKKATRASTALIREFSILERLGKMFMLWHAAHCTIEAGVYLLSAILADMDVTSQDRRKVGEEDVHILIRYVKTFPSLARRISRQWSSFVPHATKVEALADSVLETLQQWSSRQDLSTVQLDNLRGQVNALMFPVAPSDDRSIATTGPASMPSSATSLQQTIAGPIQFMNSAGPDLDLSSTRITEPCSTANFQPAWPHNEASFDQNLTLLPDAFSIDYGDPFALDFSGLSSEEIFAALLDPGQSESFMT